MKVHIVISIFTILFGILIGFFITKLFYDFSWLSLIIVLLSVVGEFLIVTWLDKNRS